MTHHRPSDAAASADEARAAAYAAAYAAAQPDPGHRVVTVEMAAGEFDWEFVPEVSTRAWGFNGTVPGPTLEATVGDVLEIRLTNRLPEPTVVHWHGLRIPAAMDGTEMVQRPVAPGETFKNLTELDLHRPHVDNVHWKCVDCGGKMTRVKDLIDVWFDSGSMPYAQWHYPFENQEKFKQQFPADYICEAVDQTRGWFYSLHAISTLLNDDVSFKNVICLGHIQDGEGRKMSKSLGNIVQPWDVLNVHGADALRWYLYTATPPGQERRFSSDLVGDVIRSFTLTLWNVYSFFITYANLHKPQALTVTAPTNDLDRWLLSELNVLVRDVTNAYETYDVTNATRPVEKFVETLSTWYVRRSRRRFWKNDSDSDKQAAYSTLYTALVTVAKLIAPAMPFIAEELYQTAISSGAPGGSTRTVRPSTAVEVVWPTS